MKEQDKIDEKLRKLLENSDSSTPFKVPDHYFYSFPEQMDKMIAQLPDFEKTAVSNPFSVPEGYFDRLPLEINEAVLAAERKSLSWKERLITFLRPSVSIPSLVTLSLVVAAFFFFTQVHTVDVNAYTANSSEEFSSSDIAQEVDESTLIQVLTEEYSETGEADDSYEEYLLDNNIDLSQLENKL
jgi:hypothetical protein